MTKPIPKECKTPKCRYLSTGGIPEHGYDRWCTRHSGPAPKMIGHCKTTGFYTDPHRVRTTIL